MIAAVQATRGTAAFVLTAAALFPYTRTVPIGSLYGKRVLRENRVECVRPPPAEPVLIQAVVCARVQAPKRDGRPLHGLVVQNTLRTADRDPETPDGLLVSLGAATDLPYRGGRYRPRTGDELLLRGVVVTGGTTPVVHDNVRLKSTNHSQ